MRRGRIGVVSLLFAGVLGCEPGPVESPPQPKPVDVAPLGTAAVASGPGYDLSPVSEPADIVGIGRWRNPMGTVASLASCSGVPAVIVEVNARMGIDVLLRKMLRTSADTRKLAALVAVDAPIDAIAVLDAQVRARPPNMAVAVGLASLDGAKVAIAPEGEAKELAPGIWRVKGDRGMACAVAASAGATPARLVCSGNEKSLTALAPYLARTAPTLDLGGPDLHVEARVDAFRKRYNDSTLIALRAMTGSIKAEYEIGDPKFDRLLFETAIAAQEDAAKMFGDIDRITVEVKAEKSGTCLRGTADVELNGTKSWLVGTLADRLDRAGPPPAIYWRLPKESEIALYGRGLDPARFTSALKLAREMLEAGLAAEKVGSPADRAKIAALIELPLGKDTTSVLAHGSVDVPLPEATSKAGQEKIIDATVKRILGWTLMGVSEGPAAVKKQLKAWVDAYKLAATQDTLKKMLGANDAKNLPTVKAGTAPASLGAGAEALEITIPNIDAPAPTDASQGTKTTKMSLTLHLVLMPDGDTTWVAFGGAKDELVKRLLVSKGGADEKAQLAARGGLDAVRNGKQMMGGFLSGAPVAHAVASFVQGANAAQPGGFFEFATGLARSLATLPNGGQTPAFVTYSGTPGARPKLSLALDLQQGTFEDMKALVISNYGMFSQLGLLP